MLKAIIFDFDGIIVDSEPLHFEAAKKTLQNFGIDLTLEEYLEFGVAKGTKTLFEKMAQKYDQEIDIAKAVLTKKELAQTLFETKLLLRKDALELIDSLSKKYTLAIATSGMKDNVYLILEKMNIKQYFEVIVVAEDVDRVKPFPDLYEKCVELLGLEKEECLAIEDSETGLLSAKAAGLKCIAVPCDFTKAQNFSQANLILNDLSEIVL